MGASLEARWSSTLFGRPRKNYRVYSLLITFIFAGVLNFLGRVVTFQPTVYLNASAGLGLAAHGRREKTAVGDHSVIGSDTAFGYMPGAQHGFQRLDHLETTVIFQRQHQPLYLQDGRHEAEQDSAHDQ